MNVNSIPIIIIGVLALSWMLWTVRLAARARRGPGLSLDSFLKHDTAIGGLSRCAAVLTMAFLGNSHTASPNPVWFGAGAALVTIALCEARWPRPSGQVRQAPLVVRGVRELLPRFGSVMAVVGLFTALVAISVCWMIGNTPDGRTISMNVDAPGDGVDRVASVGEFPGRTIGIYVVVALVVVVVLAALVARVITARATLPTVPPEVDIEFRRADLDRVLRVIAVLGFLTAGEFVELASRAFESLHFLTGTPFQDPYSWVQAASWVAAVLAIEVGRVRPRKVAAAQVISAS